SNAAPAVTIHLVMVLPFLLAAAARFDTREPITLEYEDAEHAIVRPVDPFLEHELVAIVAAQRVTHYVPVNRWPALAFYLEAAVPAADQVAATAHGIGLRWQAAQSERAAQYEVSEIHATRLPDAALSRPGPLPLRSCR